jgi:hypothetical protein
VAFAIEAGGAPVSKAVTSTPGWTRNSFAAQLESTGELVTFSIELPPSGSIELFGVQAEPQPAPGAYRKTAGQGGVYPNARFDQDWLLMEATGPDAYGTSIRIITPFQG